MIIGPTIKYTWAKISTCHIVTRSRDGFNTVYSMSGERCTLKIFIRIYLDVIFDVFDFNF